ncbi:MAG: hypothetical protein J0G95_09570 [Rhizobiales bacterium]|nr:hypothetical protein [Hyphomicrobiales bacterium]
MFVAFSAALSAIAGGCDSDSAEIAVVARRSGLKCFMITLCESVSVSEFMTRWRCVMLRFHNLQITVRRECGKAAGKTVHFKRIVASGR